MRLQVEEKSGDAKAGGEFTSWGFNTSSGCRKDGGEIAMHPSREKRP